MAGRNNRLSWASRSRSTSPDPFRDPHEPFLSPTDVPLHNLSSTSTEAHPPREHAATLSPDISPTFSPPIGFARVATGQHDGRPDAESRPQSFQGTSSIYALGSLTKYRTVDADTQKLVDRRAGEVAEWRVHWMTPALALVLFVAGVAAAIAHHLWYAHLHGQPAEEQLRKVRYGTALAFFVKSSLVGTVIICYRQRIWHTFRLKAMTMRGIDGLFSATEDPSQFFYNWEMIRNGKLATFMAVCSWLIPIASVLSPSALTSEVIESFDFTQCPAVASLNFTHEAMYDFRNESFYAGSSLVYYNTTDPKGEEPDYFDYYDQPSKNARRLSVTSMYLKKPATDPNASLQSCGERWNCTYDISFEGPGYKCDEIASNEMPDTGEAPFRLSSLAPNGNYIYFANVDIGDYVSPQVPTGDNGVPSGPPPYPESLGVLQSEPVLWIGHSVKTDDPYPKDSPYAQWKTVHEPHIFKCVAYRTNYTFQMRYNDTVQTHTRSQRDFLSPLIETTVSSSGNTTSATPASEFVSPKTNKQIYKQTASYHAMGQLLRNFLRGSISYNNSFTVTKSDISETRLMDARISYPLPNLMDELPLVFEDMLITLLSEPHLTVAQNESVPCNKSRSVNVFIYHPEALWIGYAIAVGLTLAFLFVGAWAIFQNGVASDTLFSRIMVTTRNPTLDRLSVGACLGGDPFPKELERTKLRFGVLREEDVREGPLGRVEHVCFGASGEVGEIRRGGTYAGLARWRKEVHREEEGEAWEKARLLDEKREEVERR